MSANEYALEVYLFLIKPFLFSVGQTILFSIIHQCNHQKWSLNEYALEVYLFLIKPLLFSIGQTILF